MNPNKEAALYSKKEVIINSPINKVWKIQSDINNWPKWQKDISYSNLDGKLSVGTTFRWKALGMNIISQIQHVETENVIGWTGNSLGMHAVHYWYFKKIGNTTKVITEESLSGWFPQILKLFNQNFLNNSLVKSLNLLKHQAETVG